MVESVTVMWSFSRDEVCTALTFPFRKPNQVPIVFQFYFLVCIWMLVYYTHVWGHVSCHVGAVHWTWTWILWKSSPFSNH